MTRTRRLTVLARLLSERRYTSQEALARALAKEGLPVTQATLSRDLRNLGAGKRPGADGQAAYELPTPAVEAFDRERQRLDLQAFVNERRGGAEPRGRAHAAGPRQRRRPGDRPDGLRRHARLGRRRRHAAGRAQGRARPRGASRSISTGCPASSGVDARNAPVSAPPVHAAHRRASARRGYAGAEFVRLARRAPGRHGRRPRLARAAGRAAEDFDPGLDPARRRPRARRRSRRGSRPCSRTAPSTRSSPALPHGAWRTLAAERPALAATPVRIVDLSSDFRDGSAGYVYGLPEAFRDRLAGATRVANPGCYPTAAALALLPGGRGGLARRRRHGRRALGRQRRRPRRRRRARRSSSSTAAPRSTRSARCTRTCRRWSARSRRFARGRAPRVAFAPQLVPMARGILLTAQAPLARAASADEIARAVRRALRGEPFVRLLPAGHVARDARGARLEPRRRAGDDAVRRHDAAGDGGDRQPGEGRGGAGAAEPQPDARLARDDRPPPARTAVVSAAPGRRQAGRARARGPGRRRRARARISPRSPGGDRRARRRRRGDGVERPARPGGALPRGPARHRRRDARGRDGGARRAGEQAAGRARCAPAASTRSDSPRSTAAWSRAAPHADAAALGAVGTVTGDRSDAARRAARRRAHAGGGEHRRGRRRAAQRERRRRRGRARRRRWARSRSCCCPTRRASCSTARWCASLDRAALDGRSRAPR